MNKIICEICGTTYPDSSECCPICGCSSAAAAEFLGADIQYDDIQEDISVKPTSFAGPGRKKEIFDFDEVNSENVAEDEEDPEEEYDAEEEDSQESPRHNTFVVILLTILIVVLLGVAAFLYLRFFMPNKDKEEAVPTTAAIQQTEVLAETTEPTVPCQHMAMINASVAELNAEGQQFLLHIKVLPENTTDPILYISENESIATVTEDGKITAISEGETVIYISCGEYSIPCPVIVKYVEETVPPTTEVVVEENSSETTPDETVQNEDGTQTDTQGNSPALRSDVTLKLKKTDIRLGVYYGVQLELDCDLTPEEVTWSSEHPHIAKVDEQGNVTAVKDGTTSITAKYGDQEVQCIVRCVWY